MVTNFDMPLVSVIIPCYNARDYILEAINSCKKQDYPNIEIIVVDDGSTDGSLELLRNECGFTLIEQTNRGACVARNRGLKEAKGKYVKFLDSDDILYDGCIKNQVNFSSSLTPDSIGFGYSESFDKTGIISNNHQYHSISKGYTLTDLVLKNIVTSLSLYPSDALKDIGGFDERLHSRQEWNLNLRLKLAGYHFVFDDVFTYYQRHHEGAFRISNRTPDMDSEYENIKKAVMPLLSSDDVDARNAAAFKVWSVGRWYCIRHRKEVEIFFDLARSFSNSGFDIYFTNYYRVLLKIFGPYHAEYLSRIFNMRYVSKKFKKLFS